MTETPLLSGLVVLTLTLHEESFLCQMQERQEEKWRRIIWEWKRVSSDELLAQEKVEEKQKKKVRERSLFFSEWTFLQWFQ